MKILVIKQTSLGDVLHATGHIRTIKQTWPESELFVLTANSSADIYRHSPWIDHLILIDRYRVKHNWYREPVWCYRHMRQILKQVRAHQFDMAFDLQGLAKSVVFLYGARADKKYVKGRWLGLAGFHQPQLHALSELDGVLSVAGIEGIDTAMEFSTSSRDVQEIDKLLDDINPQARPILIFSAFSRWPSKDWPLVNFFSLANELADEYLILMTGAAERSGQIERQLEPDSHPGILNLAGKISLLEFAELVKRAALMVTGDSFPMHVAVACNTPVVALFGPTDEAKVGPIGDFATVIRAPECRRCDRRDCPRACLDRIPTETVKTQLINLLERVATI